MPKRDCEAAELDDDDQHEAKRARATNVDGFSRLSDELILRILSYLPVTELVRCQR